MRLVNSNNIWLGVIFCSIIMFAPGIWFLIKYHNSNVMKIGDLSISVGSPNTTLLIYGLLFIFVGLMSIVSYIYVYSNVKSGLIEYFDVCPFCKGSTLAKISFGLSLSDKQTVWCRDCGAKWVVKTSGFTGNIKSVKLVKPGNNGEGQEYLGKETDPEFWTSIGYKK